MPTALITAIIKTLAIYLILAICYLIFFLSIRKSSIIDKSQRSLFIKHVAIMHAIYFIPIVLINLFHASGYHVITIISAIIFMVVGYPISNLILKYERKENQK